MNRTGARSDGGCYDCTCHDLCLHGEHGKLPLEALTGPDQEGAPLRLHILRSQSCDCLHQANPADV